MTTSYPLNWPDGWTRTDTAKRNSGNRFNTTFDRARRELMRELRLLGARNVVISSWLPIKANGEPYGAQARRGLVDPGVAVYFTLRKRQMVMARDAYLTVHDNLRSIGLAISHLRGMERHGGAGMMERAFEGFAALPVPDQFDAWAILGLKPGADRDAIEAKFRELAKRHHPDVGGASEAFLSLHKARRTLLDAMQ